MKINNVHFVTEPKTYYDITSEYFTKFNVFVEMRALKNPTRDYYVLNVVPIDDDTIKIEYQESPEYAEWDVD